GITGANLATAQSVITDSTTSENRATGLGLIGAVYGIGFVLGPILSGIALLLTDSNYAAPAFLAAGFALLSVILTTFMLDETHPPEERGGETKERGVNFGRLFQYFIDPSLGPVFWLVLGQSIIFGAFYLTFAPFTLNVLGLDILGNTIFFAVFGIISATMQGGFTGRLSSRYGERTLVLSGLMLYSIGFLLVSTTPHVAVPWYSRDALTEEIQQQVNSDAGEIEGQLALLPSEENKGIGGLIYILIAILPVPIGFGIANPNINSLITKRGDPSKIGEALGVGAAFLALGNVIGPLIGGALFDYIGPNSVTRVGGIAGFILLYMLSSRITKRAGDEKKLDDDFSG
ncbi:MAG: MFS transporter, partial [Chloroflexota bacterium]